MSMKCRYCEGLGVEVKMKSNKEPRWCRMGCVPSSIKVSLKEIKFGKGKKGGNK